MTISRSAQPLDEILLAFAAEADHGQATLSSYLVRFPEHAEALAALAAEIALSTASRDQPVPVDDPAVAKAWAVFQSTAPLETKSVATSGMLANLEPGRFLALAKTLDVNAVFLSRIRDRLVAFATIPHAFLVRLAEAAGGELAALAAELDQPPAIATGQRFKAEGKPATAAQMTFAEAIASSHLTTEQRAKLEALSGP